MKLLIYEWNAFTYLDLFHALKEEKIDFRIARIDLDPKNVLEQDRFKEKLENMVEQGDYDAVFSINFFDCIAEVCHEKNKLYIAWTYDSPAMGGRVKSFYFPNNHIFMFDSAEVKKYKKEGHSNFHHLNLAVDVKRYNQFRVTPMEQLKYNSEISFVGQLYENMMQEIMGTLTPYSSAYLSALVDIQMRNYNVNLMEPLVNERLISYIETPAFLEKMKPFMEEKGILSGKVTKGAMIELLMTRVTNRERILLLAVLSKYHQVKLFSGDRHQVLENLIFCGKVDYYKEMPKVFKCSKINLNITKRGIEKGIPLRCLDIMGCRGFLLTNYQEDLLEYLEEGKDMAIYYSIEDALEKAEFYLKNDKIREEIANRGYKKVKDLFNYHNQLEKIWKITGLK